MYLSDFAPISHWSNSVHRPVYWGGFDNLIYHWAPQVLNFVAAPPPEVTEVDQLTLPQW